MMASLPEVYQAWEHGGRAATSVPDQTQTGVTSQGQVDLIENLLRGIDSGLDHSQQQKQLPRELQTALNGEGASQWVHVDGRWVKVDQPMAAPDASGTVMASPVQRADGSYAVTDVNTMLASSRIIEVPYDKLLSGELKYNVVIRPGDIIRVPAPIIGNVYIGGAINRPGTYALPGDKDLTLKQLIFAAGNLSPIAIPDRVDLVRRVGDDTEAIVRMNLRSIFEGTQPDFYLKPNDTINIGTNAYAPALAVLRNGFRMTYGFGFILDRNFDDKIFGFQPG
jgi:hypothetical protein